MDRDEHRRSASRHIGRTNRVTRRLGRNHHHIQIRARHDLAVMDVEAVCEGERRALTDVGLDIFAIDRGDVLVRHEHHDQIGTPDRIGDFRDLEPGLLRLAPRSAAFAQSDGDLHAGIVEILRVRVSL